MMLLSAALLALMQTIPEYTVVEVRETARGCEYKAEGRKFTEKQLNHRAQVWARQERVIEVAGDRRIAFRCVGNAMFIVQNAGVERVSFTGKPIRAGVVLLTLPAQGCIPMVDGDPLTMEQLGPAAKRWGRDKAKLHFQPDPNADFHCVDAVMTVLRANYPMKMGFVGNEAQGQ